MKHNTTTYDHIDDRANGSHLAVDGSGVVCSREVLSVALVCGDERQPGVLHGDTTPGE